MLKCGYNIGVVRIRYFKDSMEGAIIMCKAIEDMINQALKEEMIKVAKRMLKDGSLPMHKISEYVGLSVEEIRSLDKA